MADQSQTTQEKPKSAVSPVRPRAPRKQLVSVRRATSNQSVHSDEGALLQRTAVRPAPARHIEVPPFSGSRFAQDFSRVPVRARPSPTVQRDDGEPAGGAAAEGVEVPSVLGASQIGFLGDVLTVLDTTLTVGDLIGGAAGVAVLEGVTFMAAAATVSVVGAIVFLIGGLFMLADAWSSGRKWAAVQGASYALVCISHGQAPPTAPAWMGEGETFNSTGLQVLENLRRRVDANNDESRRVLSSLYAISQAQPETILNQIYQRLVAEKLQATFLGIQIGGVLYQTARGTRLTWPGVGVEHVSRD